MFQTAEPIQNALDRLFIEFIHAIFFHPANESPTLSPAPAAAPARLFNLGKFLIFTASFVLISASIADEANQADYEERLARYDLEADPGKHRTLASWCKRNYPAKYTFHQRAYDNFQFLEYEQELGEKPSISDLKEAGEYAAKLELFEKAREYHTKWGEAQFSGYAKRLKPGNVKMQIPGIIPLGRGLLRGMLNAGAVLEIKCFVLTYS